MNMKIIALIALGVLFVFHTWLEILSSSAAKQEIPANVRDIYDEEEYKKWLAYDREKNRLSFVRHIVSYLVMFFVIGFDVYANILKLFGASEDLYRNGMLVLLADMVIGLLYAIPISYIDTMKIEQKYGFNRTTNKTFVVDQVKELIIGVIINCGICALFIAVHQALGNWMLVVFTGIMLLIVLIMVFLSPLMAKIYNKLDPLPEGELRNRLTELLESNGCTVRDIKVADASKRSSKANAYFSGFGKSKTIVLYDTLLEQMTDDEIVAVFAHEMGHNKHKDTLVMYAMNMVNTGFDCEVARRAATLKTKPLISSSAAYIAGVVTELVKKPTTAFGISIDGEKFTEKSPLLLATFSNGRFCGGGFKSSPKARLKSGFIDVCLIKEITRTKFITIVGEYRSGAYLFNEKLKDILEYRRAKTVEIDFGRQRSVCVDGEIFDVDRLRLEILPSALSIIIPRGARFAEDESEGAELREPVLQA